MFEIEDYDNETCLFCGEADGEKLISMEREDEYDADLERDILLLCDTCQEKFIHICGVLNLEEANGKRKKAKR